jgi:CheY-specific phosphatase CheX
VSVVAAREIIVPFIKKTITNMSEYVGEQVAPGAPYIINRGSESSQWEKTALMQMHGDASGIVALSFTEPVVRKLISGFVEEAVLDPD